MTGVFHIWFGRRSSTGNSVWHLFECDCDTIDALSARLSRGEIVAGNLLHTRTRRDGDDTVLEVSHRRPAALGSADVSVIELPRYRVVEGMEA